MACMLNVDWCSALKQVLVTWRPNGLLVITATIRSSFIPRSAQRKLRGLLFPLSQVFSGFNAHTTHTYTRVHEMQILLRAGRSFLFDSILQFWQNRSLRIAEEMANAQNICPQAQWIEWKIHKFSGYILISLQNETLSLNQSSNAVFFGSLWLKLDVKTAFFAATLWESCVEFINIRYFEPLHEFGIGSESDRMNNKDVMLLDQEWKMANINIQHIPSQDTGEQIMKRHLSLVIYCLKYFNTSHHILLVRITVRETVTIEWDCVQLKLVNVHRAVSRSREGFHRKTNGDDIQSQRVWI